MPTPIDPTKPLKPNRFGTLVRAYREERGWSQEELAQRWGFTRTYVSQIELGKRKLQYAEQVQRLADILEIPVEQLEAIGQAVPRQKDPVANWQESDDALLQALLEPAEATVKLAWLVWHANHDATMVGTLASLIEKLNQAIADRRGKYRRAALQILGYAHEMQGKIAFDQLDYPAAAGQFQEMYAIGEELSDADLTGLAMVHQGDLLRRRGRLEHAVRSLEAAQRYSSVGSIYTQGLRYLTLARTYAEAHQKEGFLRAIEQTQEAVTLVSPTLDTHANQFHQVGVLQERAQGHTLLGEPQVALTLYQQSEQLQPFRPMRDLGVFVILQTQAYAYAGEVERGVELALQGLRLARGYQSRRHISRVQRMYDRLAATPLGRDPHLRTLREALHS